MHMRGKAFRYDLVDAAGTRVELLNVPRYDFNWQLLYRAAEPLVLNSGSRIEATAWYDNSPENPSNPDPAKTVVWGDQTEDEMMLGYLEYVRIPASSAKTAAVPPLSLTPRALRVLGRRLDTNKDNRVSREEAGPTFLPLHQQLDQNQDGFVTAEEAKAAVAKAARP
jgi:hypothetical protein